MRGPHLALVCTSASLIVASVALAQDPYREFRIPDARSFSWNLSGAAQWFGEDTNDGSSSGPLRSRYGQFRSTTRRRSQTERHVSELGADVIGNWKDSRRWSASRSPFASADQSSQSDADDYGLAIVTNTTRYWGDSNWGADAEVSADYEFRRTGRGHNDHEVRSREYLYASSDESRAYRGSGAAAFGTGYGRVRDVTGVFDTQVLEQRLGRMGRLRHPLSTAGRQRLAQLFSVSPGLSAAHDRPSRFFWREVERIIREDEALTDSTLDAVSVLRLLEPLTPDFHLLRLVGWRVSARYLVSLERGHTDRDSRQQYLVLEAGVPVYNDSSETHLRSKLKETTGFVQLTSEFHRPVGIRWQTSLGSTVTYGDGERRVASLASSAEVDRLVADRWLVSASVNHEVTGFRREGAPVHPIWNLTVVLGTQYFVEDSWSLYASYQHAQSRAFSPFYYYEPEDYRYDRTSNFQLGLTYRPIGRFEAPGLGISERLTPVRL